MIDFIKGSFREVQHVVWPTRTETTNFFISVLIILILFSVYLYIFNILFQGALFSLDNIL